MRNTLQISGSRLAAQLAALVLSLAGSPSQAEDGRVSFADSVRPVPAAPGNGPYIVRPALSADEAAAPMTISVVLKMRNFSELQARLAAGQTVSREEMEAKYLPLASDYQKVAGWLAGERFTSVFSDINRTVITVSGSVSQVAKSMGVAFARVAVPDEGGAAAEFSSAVTTPSLPAGIADPVGINRLQPHLQFHHAPGHPPGGTPGLHPQDLVGGAAYITPDDIAAAYHTPSAWTGKGQVIAIVDQGSVQSSDLNSFWSAVGLSQNASDVAVVNVDGGPIDSDDSETALDVEWAGALAPAAQIRLYLAPDPIDDPLPQILADLGAFPTMKVVSISYGAAENQSEIKEGAISLAEIQSISQEIAQLAAAGVTVVVAAGDSGSNPDPVTGFYSPSNPLSVNYPASDPDAAGVGGTSMTFNSNWADTGEAVWNQLTGNEPLATGGGVSTVFPAPSWQTGTPNSTARCVPDIVAPAAGSSSLGVFGALIYVTNRAGSPEQAVVGTSVATPIWAGIVADINQARTAAGLPSLGLLGPQIYPLAGTAALHDITSGNNGAYSAGVGYDLASGLGSPNVTNLIAALGGGTAPATTAPPPSAPQAAGASGSSGSSGGGGGAPSLWFYAALALLAAGRLIAGRGSARSSP